MVRRTVNGGEREYLIIEYAPSKRGQPGDRLFVPADSLDQVTKYVGGEAPSLTRLGGAEWAKRQACKAVAESAEVKVDLPVAAIFPADYLPGEQLRLEAYRALASAKADDAIDAVRAELVERYGAIPAPVENLLAVAKFKVICRRYGVTEVSLQGAIVRMSPLDLPEAAQQRLGRLYERSLYKHSVGTVWVPRPRDTVKPDASFAEVKFGGEPLRDIPLLTWCAQLLGQITGL
jgi:transcription-repair coupling factor (superfamily II helicase)